MAKLLGGLRPWWAVLLVGTVVLFLGGFASLEWWIQADALDKGRAAQREFAGDEVEALMALVQSEKHPLAERNRAVWALGQLSDARALPVLRTYYTGEPCQHDKFLCQYELKKAIDLCEGASRAASFLRRWLGRPTEKQ